MAWAKLHTDILGDPKLLRAARLGSKGLEYLPWLFAFAKGANDDGRLTVGGQPAEPADIAPLIPGATARLIGACLTSLEAIGVLVRDTDQALRFASWETRSGSRSSDAPEAVRVRVQRHREKRRAESRNAAPVTYGNAIQLTEGNAAEGEGEKKREEESRGEGEAERDTDGGGPLAACFDDPEHRSAYAGYRRAASVPDGFDGALRSLHEPITGGVPGYPWPVIGAALVDLRGNGERFNVKRFRGFCRDVVEGRQPATTAVPTGGEFTRHLSLEAAR